MKKFVKVINGIKSTASDFEYKIDEVNVSKIWNPKGNNPKEMGGFNFGTEDIILRFIFRGDTIYDVIIPEDAEIIECEHPNVPHGVFRSNKIIITNPKKITEEMVIDIYKKSNLPEKTYYQCLLCLLFKKYVNAVKYIIKDRINQNNIDEAIKQFEYYASLDKGIEKQFNYNELFDEAKEIYDILKSIQNKC